MYSQEETITPAIAKKYLALNIENNRNVSQGVIDTYASDMEDELWISDTGDNIKFNTKGQLVDGQQRLLAVIQANVPVKMWVAYDVSNDAFPVIDTGRSRTFAHTLKFEDAVNPNRTGAIVKWIYMFDKGYPTNKGMIKPSHTRLMLLYTQNPGGFEEASRRAEDIRHVGMNASGVGGVAY